MRYFFTCVWYRQSAADTSPTTLSQVNERTAKPSPFSIQGRLSEFFQIMAAKTLKNPYRLITDSDVQTFLRSRRKPKYEKKNRKTLVMVFLATENENRQLELDLPQADVDVYVKDFFGREGMSQ